MHKLVVNIDIFYPKYNLWPLCRRTAAPPHRRTEGTFRHLRRLWQAPSAKVPAAGAFGEGTFRHLRRLWQAPSAKAVSGEHKTVILINLKFVNINLDFKILKYMPTFLTILFKLFFIK
jgi:hypothetical protein